MTNLLLGPVIGGLSHNRAFLWGRADGPATLHAWLGQQPDLSDATLAAKSLPLTPDDGFAGVAPLFNLSPDTRYHYALTLDDTPPHPANAPYPTFTTFPPDGQPASFAFAFGSCFRPSGANGGQIFRALDTQRQKDSLRFVLLIGDQIYADSYRHNGLGRVACTLDEYRAIYAYTFSRPPFRQLLASLPAFMTLDDHEVDDDWHWLDGSRQWAHLPPWDQFLRWLKGRPPQERHIPRQRVQDALQAYWEHQAMHAPGFVVPPTLERGGQYALDADMTGSLAYTFNFGAAAFFVMDTRTQRVRGRRGEFILGPQQWQALEDWLLSVKDAYPVKFLVTSAALLFRMFLDFPADRWSGFPKERARLLNFLAHRGIEGVYLIAGDLHSAHAMRADLYGPEGRSIPLWEFCSTPFEQKPNWLARWAYNPLPNGPIKRLRRHFDIGKPNYGVVRVDFPSGGKPRVIFEVYGERGELLGKAGG